MFSEEKLDKLLLKNLKISSYGKNSLLQKWIGLAENDIDKINKNNQIPTRTDYVKKTEIDRSTLYSFDGPFQLVHVNVTNLKFLGKIR